MANDESTKDTANKSTFDPSQCKEYTLHHTGKHMCTVCPSNLSSPDTISNPVFQVLSGHIFQSDPSFTIKSSPSISDPNSTENAGSETLAVAYIKLHSMTIGLGDPAIETGEGAIVWEKLIKKNKWKFDLFGFEVSLPVPSSSNQSDVGSGSSGSQRQERRMFEWRRRKIYRMPMDLVEVGPGADQSIVLAHYIGAVPFKSRKRRAQLWVRDVGVGSDAADRLSHYQGQRWEAIVWLTSLCIAELKRRND